MAMVLVSTRSGVINEFNSQQNVYVLATILQNILYIKMSVILPKIIETNDKWCANGPITWKIHLQKLERKRINADEIV